MFVYVVNITFICDNEIYFIGRVITLTAQRKQGQGKRLDYNKRNIAI